MIEIKIKLDGNFPGAAEHRFSVDAMSAPMEKLLHAARSIATQIVKNALDETEYGVSGGRLARDAEKLDLQIENVDEGSLVLKIVLVLGLMQGRLFEDLPSKTGKILVDAIRDESAGRPTSGVVRKYLHSLPSGVSAQKYELFEDGTLVSRVEFGAVELAVVPETLPYLISLSAQVVGVGFEPGKTEVRVRTESGQITFSATAEQVEAALKIRSGSVQVRAVAHKKGHRLLSIRSLSDAGIELSDADKRALVFDKWSGLLKRLA